VIRTLINSNIVWKEGTISSTLPSKAYLLYEILLLKFQITLLRTSLSIEKDKPSGNLNV